MICRAENPPRTGAVSPLVELYAPIAADLRAVEEVFDREILSDVAFVNELCERVRSYRGKMLRPALLLLTGQACGKLTPQHRVLAAVVEMVHMATLVHDDVLDVADERRRQPTINATEGNVSAVLLGDYLISHAFHLCSSLDSQRASRLVGQTTNIVCEGELMQNRLRGRLDMTEAQYFDVIRRKTAALTATACELGAAFADAAPPCVQAMRKFGDCAGTAFQIVDDLLDLVGAQEEVGKTLGRDLDLCKPTLPIIHALATATPDAQQALHRLLQVPCEPEHARAVAHHARVREMLDRCGSLEYAWAYARRLVNEAVHCLAGLPVGPARTSLTRMAEFVLQRSY
ncbi:MAG: polyprenyl synthetase family protein [Phycisphaerales bacterium]|nr:polyprenyl synthetase family protein [Phycisphaerales bacterium]